MIQVAVEVGEDATNFAVPVRAESIERAVSFARGLYPSSEVRVLFPINPEAFFDGKMGPAVGQIWLEVPEGKAG